MKKIDVTNYMTEAKLPDPTNPHGPLKTVESPFRMKESLSNLMFAPALRLTGPELMRQQALAMKLESVTDGVFLVEQAEYERLVNAVTTFQGFGRDHVEFVRRILEAEDVEVTEKTEGEADLG